MYKVSTKWNNVSIIIVFNVRDRMLVAVISVKLFTSSDLPGSETTVVVVDILVVVDGAVVVVVVDGACGQHSGTQ